MSTTSVASNVPLFPRHLRIRSASALCALIVSSLGLLAGSALAAPSEPDSPKVIEPDSPKVIFVEDFEKGTDNTAVGLTDYTGSSTAYSADDAWLVSCNGVVLNYNTISPVVAAPFNNCNLGGNQAAAMNNMRTLVYALGALKGDTDPDANHAATAYTQTAPGANKVQIESSSPIKIPVGGRFVVPSVDGAAVTCGTASAPSYAFYVGAFGGSLKKVGSTLPGCKGDSFVKDNITARAKTYTASAAVLVKGTDLQFQLRNPNASGLGNDGAFDNIRLLDVTPSLDRSFADAAIVLGGSTQLTFTVTNTSDLRAKNGWGFSDSLPVGMTLADAVVGGTCAVTTKAAAGVGAVAVTKGSLKRGQESCTITVNVTASKVGAYVDGASGVKTAGLNPPSDATLNVEPVPGKPGLHGPSVAMAFTALGACLLIVGRKRWW